MKRPVLTPVLTLMATTLALVSSAPGQIGFGNQQQQQGQVGVVGSDVKLEPPSYNPTQGGSTVGFMPMVVGFLFLGLVLGVAMIPSKRGHQD